MLSSIRQKKNEGFTIIEVLIVLAIAGLIMLIVFLAVPALQRNARNTQRRSDVGNILSAITEFSNDNNGSIPDTAAVVAGGGLTISNAADNTTTAVQGAKLGFYTTTGTNTTIKVETWANYSALSGPTANDKVLVVTGASCSGNNPQQGTVRSTVAVFYIEPGQTQQCQGS